MKNYTESTNATGFSNQTIRPVLDLNASGKARNERNEPISLVTVS